MNDYELACERFERISRDYKTITDAARAVIQWAIDEYEAAQANLRQYESQPGIPLPQYRESGGEDEEPAGGWHVRDYWSPGAVFVDLDSGERVPTGDYVVDMDSGEVTA